jgi:putative PIG3 family NAD(P)H quinone oxidoreductase
VGDTVCALTHGGGYAEYVAAPETHCLPIPEGVDIIDAAGLPEAVFTVWHNMVERGDLKAGERVLIHGATSGIGVFAVQIAKALGAEVITTAGSDEKCAFGRDLGADLAVNYRTEDFAAIAKELGGLDVVLDMVAGDYPERTLPVMKPDGRYVIIAVQGGLSGSCPYAAVLTKRLMLTGSTLRPQSVEQKAAIARAVHTHVWPMIVEGRVKPVRDVTFALEHAADAHKRMESGAHRGKILLVNEG